MTQQPVLQAMRSIIHAACYCLMRSRTSMVAVQPPRQAVLCSKPPEAAPGLTRKHGMHRMMSATLAPPLRWDLLWKR